MKDTTDLGEDARGEAAECRFSSSQHSCRCTERAPRVFKGAVERVGRLLKMTPHPSATPPQPPHRVVDQSRLHIFTKHIIKHNRVFITDCQEIPLHLHSNLICHTEAHASKKSSCIPPTFSPTHEHAHTQRHAHPAPWVFNALIKGGGGVPRSPHIFVP